MHILYVCSDESMMEAFFNFYRCFASDGGIIVAERSPSDAPGDFVHVRSVAEAGKVVCDIQSVIFIGAPSLATIRQTLFHVANTGAYHVLVFDGCSLIPFAQHLQRRRPKRRRICMICPGLVLPLKNGSRVRFFDTLISCAILHDVVLAVPESIRKSGRRLALIRALGVEIVANAPPWRDAASTRIQFRRDRLLSGKGEAFRSISSRASACRLSAQSVEVINARKPDIVLFSYAWSVDPRIRARLRVLDTIDVISVRTRTILGDSLVSRRLLRGEEERERRILEEVDLVVAISRKDFGAFREMGAAQRLKLGYPSFAWMTPRPRVTAGRMRVGFLGGPMAANVAGARLAIESLSQSGFFDAGHLFVVAGDVGHRLGVVRDGVVVLGWLPNLVTFYDMVDVVYAPITVAGGLNFKIFEALAAGRCVVTNALGAEEFRYRAARGDVRIADTPQELADVIEALRVEGARTAPTAPFRKIA